MLMYLKKQKKVKALCFGIAILLFLSSNLTKNIFIGVPIILLGAIIGLYGFGVGE